jgi:glycopeptide antibiotics resistance protein
VRTGKALRRSRNNEESNVRSEWISRWAGWVAPGTVIAILAGTLFPYNFCIQKTAVRRTGPFLLWLTPVAGGWFSWFANVLLFVPFGFGLAWWGRKNGWRKLPTLIAVTVAGCALSMVVEFLQLYIPSRFSSWDDVVTNTVGSLVGCLFFQRWGMQALRYLERMLSGCRTSAER